MNLAGDLQATFVMKKATTFVAEFAGDLANEPDSSPLQLVQVYPRATGTMVGFYARSGGYALYRYTSSCPTSVKGCPRYTASLIPNHAGDVVTFQVQVRPNDAWRTATTFKLRLGSLSKVSAILVYADRRIIGVPTRVRFSFAGDGDHLPRTSSWSYFKVKA